ncbi:quinone oxidoreductase family protein [Polyangium aurulentum]|uniref:quinone oxidoreductase family protein n=1 Tax=Polyangium aurulentum TaxID=2567896 RepID=UPI0010AE4483|nr:quinone oxidoreductase [Polyangium aurulentum]UQA61179.1 quinone oxidoreductase [Polyangium aurulentum]
MRAIVVPQPGGREVLSVAEMDTPTPGPGGVLVRVEAAGVNFIDVYQRSGAYKMPLPGRLGLEGAGVVEAIGSEVSGIAPGARVAWTSVPGSYASHVVVPADKLVTVPEGIDTKTAAAAILQGMTAQFLCTSTYALKEGDACIVHAAAGGVGQLLCQMADQAGAFVFGTVSTREKAQLAREAGADEVIFYRDVDFSAEARRLTNGAGVHVVYDSVGKDTFDRSLASLARRGMLVLYGQSSGAVPPFDPQRLNAAGSIFLTRPTLGDYTRTREELDARAADVFSRIAQGKLRIRIHAEVALADAAEAHRMLEGRETTGKVLIIP